MLVNHVMQMTAAALGVASELNEAICESRQPFLEGPQVRLILIVYGTQITELWGVLPRFVVGKQSHARRRRTLRSRWNRCEQERFHQRPVNAPVPRPPSVADVGPDTSPHAEGWKHVVGDCVDELGLTDLGIVPARARAPSLSGNARGELARAVPFLENVIRARRTGTAAFRKPDLNEFSGRELLVVDQRARRAKRCDEATHMVGQNVVL